MATITKRSWTTSSGEAREAWVTRYADQDGRWHLKTFPRQREAKDWLATTVAAVKRGTHRTDRSVPTTGQAAEAWLRRSEADGLERGTLEPRRRHIALHILPLVGADTRLNRIDIDRFRDELLRTRSRAMAAKVMVSFRAILKLARMGHLGVDVAAIPTGGRHRRRLEVGVDLPTPAEVNTLLAAASLKERALIALAALAGLRASELRGLKWSDLDLGADPSVTVRERVDQWGVAGPPKSASSRRTVPLGETATRALKEWRLAQPPGRTLVFGTANDRPDLLTNLRRRLLNPLCAAAGVRNYGWHSFRHYAVSSWLRVGIDIKMVQSWAGHASAVMTLDRYGHMIPRADDRARLAAVEALLGT